MLHRGLQVGQSHFPTAAIDLITRGDDPSDVDAVNEGYLDISKTRRLWPPIHQRFGVSISCCPASRSMVITTASASASVYGKFAIHLGDPSTFVGTACSPTFQPQERPCQLGNLQDDGQPPAQG